MTNEEARAILEEVKTIDDSMYQYNPAYLEALEMAIAALKAEPCEDCRKAEEIMQTLCDYGCELKIQDAISQVLESECTRCEDAIKRESVLNTLDTMDKALDENRTVEHYKELLKECFKELPRVTPKITECADAVSREAVEECKELMTDINGETVYAVRMSDIRKLPPVAPKPKTGKWVEGQTIGDGITCSECSTHYSLYPTFYRFCPNCGAKMEGESE